ncbi:MAG TPA: serine--tRNA ligase [Candidatus Magasanikbacteria bacterium]|nr:serine--tRNA ligase [Candidatus Magasanikbacteria bacterium]
MLDIKYIREHKEEVQKNCKDRHVKVDIDALLTYDDQMRAISPVLETLRADRNKSSKTKPTPEVIEKMKALGEEVKKAEKELESLEEKRKALLLQVPNLTHKETPIGGEDDFKVVSEHLSAPTFGFTPKDHETLMLERDWIDFERGAKVAGSKFYFVKNDLVRLNQALITYGTDIAVAHGFELIETPDLARHDVLESAGFNPRGEETQIYSIAGDDLSLIGTAEISVLGYHSDEVLDLSKGPKKYVALSHCFRTEAGAYGRTSKGLYRVHQFTKLEMFVFCAPEDSEHMHEELLSIEKEICDGLEIPYRVIDIASGDLGGPAYRKFDIEAWMVMNEGYGEVTSTSNCTDYQARRANIKYKNSEGKSGFVHTLNGTAIVTSRFPIALIENHQNEDGTINIPKALQKYLGKKSI